MCDKPKLEFLTPRKSILTLGSLASSVNGSWDFSPDENPALVVKK